MGVELGVLRETLSSEERGTLLEGIMGDEVAEWAVVRWVKESVVQTVVVLLLLLELPPLWLGRLPLLFQSGKEILLGIEKGSSIAPCLLPPVVGVLLFVLLIGFPLGKGL
jgi:hypothetical protein